MSYYSVSQNFFSNSSTSRPPLYPMIIYIGEAIPFLDWKIFIIIVNWILHLFIGYLLWKIFYFFNLKSSIIFFVVLIILISPRLLYFKYDLSPEILFSFLICLLFYLSIKIISDNTKRLDLKYLIGIGIINGLCTLTKPIWLLGGILLPLSFLICKRNNIIKFSFFFNINLFIIINSMAIIIILSF